MKRDRVIPFLISVLLAFGLPARAEDIDLFVGVPPNTTPTPPNVLFLVDNTANWNTAFTNEMTALADVFNGLAVNGDGSAKFNVGIMMFSETGSPNSNTDGGYVRAAIRAMNTANKGKYAALITSLDKLGDKSNGGKISTTMADAYFYFASDPPYAGNNKVKADYTGNTTGTAQSKAVYALSGNALSGFAGTPYIGPNLANCAKNYIIYISNGAPQDNTSDINSGNTMLGNAGGSTAKIVVSPAQTKDMLGDEWARFMKQSPEQITTYTLDINKVTTGQGPAWTAQLKSMAAVSGGKYFDVSSSVASNISDALNTVLSEILAVNSVFASVSLPASANTQSTFLNQVFIGMFRPDGDAMPRWPGNLKQYKLAIDTTDGDVQLVDAGSNSAINASTGFVTECARSFWTPGTVDTYWTTQPQGSCLAVPNSAASNYPDGPVVEKGAQAYVLRGSTTRTVKTCDPTFGSCTSLTNFNDANASITKTLLGDAAMTNTTRTNMINWARGLDVGINPVDERINGVTSAEMRASAHGDVVHSRPVAINYGGDDYLGTDAAVADAQVVVYYSGNDGMLRAVNGNRSMNIGTYSPGQEIWSFVAPEFWGSIKRLYDNNTRVSYPGIGGQAKPYANDGPITAYEGAVNGVAGKKFLYSAMRRGGRALYAFDVSTLGSPVLKWKRGCPNLANDTGCTTGWTGLGQTWSPATPVKAEGYTTSPVLLMGGGYDSCEDYDGLSAGTANHNCSTTKGNKVYVVDADTGTLLRAFDTLRGVIGAITPVIDPSGNIQYAYAADLGGNLYRISGATANTPIGNTAPGSWTITKIASLGCDDPAASCVANRKFLFGPDVVVHNGGYMLLVGAGDREKPLSYYAAANAVQNHFFAVQDRPTQADWLSTEAGTNCSGQSVICRNSLLAIPANANPTPEQLAAKKGWYLALASTENVVTSAITVSNRLTFSTFKPAVYDANACSGNLGEANVYNLNYTNAAPIEGTTRFERITGDGLPPSPVAGKVILDDGTIVPFLIGGSADSPLEATNPNTAADFEQPKTRVYWHIQK